MRRNKEKKVKTRYQVRVSPELSEFIDRNADKREMTSAAFIRFMIGEYRTKQEVQT